MELLIKRTCNCFLAKSIEFEVKKNVKLCQNWKFGIIGNWLLKETNPCDEPKKKYLYAIVVVYNPNDGDLGILINTDFEDDVNWRQNKINLHLRHKLTTGVNQINNIYITKIDCLSVCHFIMRF